MITKMSHTLLYVLDQDSAKEFYTTKLGFDVHFDMTMGEGFDGAGWGFRWLTVGPRDQPEVEIVLADPGMGHDEQTANDIRALVAKGALGRVVWLTDDCQKTFEEFSARGVVFTSGPSDRPYGIEAIFRDDSGNSFSLTERREFTG